MATDNVEETIAGPTRASWREGALTRTAELEVLTEYFRRYPDEPVEVLASRIQRHVNTARDAAVDLLRMAPNGYGQGQVPSLLGDVRPPPPAGDPRRTRMEELSWVARER